jgi:hypothetical protein
MDPELQGRVRTTVAFLLVLLAFVGVLMFFLTDAALELPAGLLLGLLFATLLTPLLILALRSRPSADIVSSRLDRKPRHTTIGLGVLAVALFGGGILALAPGGVGGSVLMVLAAIVGMSVVARIPRSKARRQRS